MLSKWQWLFLQFTRKLWFRATMFALAGIGTALLAFFLEHLIPGTIPGKIGAQAVDGILNILASSMLAVTTFSLSIMVAAYSAATSNVTPRATTLIMQDSTTQNVLATFIGSFLFSLVGIVALSTGMYGDSGRVILFVVTLGVIALIVATLLRWIDHLSRLGRVGETTHRVEEAAATALRARIEHPYLGGRKLQDVPRGAKPIRAAAIGYLQHIDMDMLSRCAGEAGQVFVTAVTGAFVHPARPLAWITGLADNVEEKVRAAFTIDDERSYDQDPRFGLIVLSEIASRALSPAVNDPGTAIDVIGRAMRLLYLWEGRSESEIVHPRVWVPALELDDLFDDVFSPIARDGAGLVEVHVRLQKAFQALAQVENPEFRRNALRHSALAMKRTAEALTLDEEKALLAKLATAV